MLCRAACFLIEFTPVSSFTSTKDAFPMLDILILCKLMAKNNFSYCVGTCGRIFQSMFLCASLREKNLHSDSLTEEMDD